jgi:catalase-peroxidase
MNDEETVALIAGGHTFGKTHGAGDPDLVGPSPRAARCTPWAWAGSRATAPARAPTPSPAGLEGAWTPPDRVGQQLLRHPVRLRVGAHREPGRRQAVEAEGRRRRRSWCPTPTTRRSVATPPMMLTTDLALITDPEYRKISERFHENPDEFADAFAKAWYKLLHRDMGPVSRYLGPWVPEPQLWQDPVPAGRPRAVDDADVADLKASKLLDSGPVRRPAGVHRLGVGVASAAPTSAAAPTAPASAWPRRRTGRSTSRPSWPRCCRPSSRSSRTSTTSQSGGKRSRWPT